jgi:hypothetical protein
MCQGVWKKNTAKFLFYGDKKENTSCAALFHCFRKILAFVV